MASFNRAGLAYFLICVGAVATPAMFLVWIVTGNGIWEPVIGLVAGVIGLLLLVLKAEPHQPQGLPPATGGRGGDARVGGRGVAIGGDGGGGGFGARGGDGGSGDVAGDGYAFGGHGGQAGQPDGSGGRGGDSPLAGLDLTNPGAMDEAIRRARERSRRSE